MKHIFQLILLLSFWASTTQVTAQNNSRNSILQFKLRNDKLLTIVIDGRHYKKYGKKLSIGNVPYGMHEIKIYRYYPNDDPRYDGYNKRALAKLVYKGKIRVEPSTMYYCTIDPEYHTMGVREDDIPSWVEDDKTIAIDSEPDFTEKLNTENTIKEVSKNNFKQEIVRETSTPPPPPPPATVNNANTNKTLLQIATMSSLATQINTLKTDTEIMNLLKNKLADKYYNISQLSTMLDWFTFEGSKLEWVKWSITHLQNPNEVAQLKSKFSFTSSKNEIDKLIKK